MVAVQACENSRIDLQSEAAPSGDRLMLACSVKNRWIMPVTSVTLILIVAMGGASRRMIVAVEYAAQCTDSNDGRSCQEGPSPISPNPYSTNPALFSSDRDRAALSSVDRLPPAIADDQTTHSRARVIDGVYETRSVLSTELLSLQAWFVRLQV